MDNLLVDPHIRVTTAPGHAESMSLPSVLAALATSETPTFAALMPHQAHAWRTFLAQLAALALHRSGQDAPPATADEWRVLLRDLTSRFPDDAPWRLVVENLKQPAFMQPPVPEGSLDRFKVPVFTPDTIDLLQMSRNHDVKAARIVAPLADHWVYALVSLQTMQGYSGKGNHGISRMNSGFGSRPGVGVEVGVGWSARFRRDVNVLLESRERLLDAGQEYRPTDGRGLLWLEPWDGSQSLSPGLLDPLYIEICRRVRLIQVDGRVAARLATSNSQRIAARHLLGNTGDAWTPIQKPKMSALTVPESGLTYDLLRRVLFSPDFDPAPAQLIRPDDPEDDLSAAARVLVRGQGKTAGFHHRRVPLPREARSLLATPEGRDRIGRLAKGLVDDAGNAWKHALRLALVVLVRGGPDKLPRRAKLAPAWRRRFDASVDEAFFPALWAAAAEPEDTGATAPWRAELAAIARRILREAEGALPIRTATRWRALARATRVLEWRLRRLFPDLQQPANLAQEVTS